DHGRVLAERPEDPVAVPAQPRPDRLDESEFPARQIGTAITSMYAVSAREAAKSRRLSDRAASGSSQIAYHGTSQAEASNNPSVAQPAAVTQYVEPGGARQTRRRRTSSTPIKASPKAARVKWTTVSGEAPTRDPTPSAVRCGKDQRLVRSWFWPIRLSASKAS